MFKIRLEPYDPVVADRAKLAEEVPDGLRFFRWLHECFFYRRLDPASGTAVPLVRLGSDPVRMDAALTLLKWMRSARVVNNAGFRLNPEGTSIDMGAAELDLLEEHWRAYTSEVAGASDVETVLFMKEQFQKIRATGDK